MPKEKNGIICIHRNIFPVGQIYTNGAFCRPEPVIKYGRPMWQWVVSEFIEESFYDGEPFNPVELAETRDGLVNLEGTLL